MTDYSNRSDLRNPATRQVAFTGQTYGTAAAQKQAQQAVAPGSAPGTVAAQQMAAQQAPAMRPGAKPLSRPTERPAEPITAGADFGAGPNSAQAGIMPRIVPVDQTLEQLRVLYQMFPNPDLADMISKYTESQYQ